MLPLNADQIALLCSAEPEGVAARTLRGHSELRWLTHLGLLRIARDPTEIRACV